MNASIEEAFAQSLADGLADFTPLPTVHAATIRAEKPNDVNFIVVHVAECTHDVGNLHTALLGIFVDTPVLSRQEDGQAMPVYTVAQHRELVAAVEAWMSGSKDGLAEALESLAGCVSGGHWHEANREAHSETHWITQITYRVGLRRID